MGDGFGKLSELSEHRVCKECGKEFRTKTVDGEVLTAMMQHSDHLVVHQPTAEQWTNAYEIMSAKRKKSE